MRPPPLDFSTLGLLPLKLNRNDPPVDMETPPSWNCSPISPGAKHAWRSARVEEESERKCALAAAYADFQGKVTPPNHLTPCSQRTPASVVRGDTPAMSPLNLSPRANEELTVVPEDNENESDGPLIAVCAKMAAHVL